MEMLQLINLSGNMMISLFELGHVDPIPINFVFVPSFMCLVCVYTYIYIYKKNNQAHARCVPCHNSDLSCFFPDEQCQAWIETLCANVHWGGGGWLEEEELRWPWLAASAACWRTAAAVHERSRIRPFAVPGAVGTLELLVVPAGSVARRKRVLLGRHSPMLGSLGTWKSPWHVVPPAANGQGWWHSPVPEGAEQCWWLAQAWDLPRSLLLSAGVINSYSSCVRVAHPGSVSPGTISSLQSNHKGLEVPPPLCPLRMLRSEASPLPASPRTHVGRCSWTRLEAHGAPAQGCGIVLSWNRLYSWSLMSIDGNFVFIRSILHMDFFRLFIISLKTRNRIVPPAIVLHCVHMLICY